VPLRDPLWVPHSTVLAKELPVKQCVGSGTLEIKVVELVHLKGHQLLAHIRTTMLAIVGYTPTCIAKLYYIILGKASFITLILT